MKLSKAASDWTRCWVGAYTVIVGFCSIRTGDLEAQSVPYTFTTFAGTPGSSGDADGNGATAQFWGPTGIAVDGSKNLYIADYYNHTIRKITPAGVVTAFAGLAGSFGTNDGVGSAARFLFPSGVATDSSGNVYVADFGNHAIRKITLKALVTTLAGVAGSFGYADGVGSAARFWAPPGVAVDGAGNIFVADSNNDVIRKITPDARVTTLAGSPGNWGIADGPGNVARFDGPRSVALDKLGNIYVADTYNHTIRKITAGGLVATFAGLPGSMGNSDGTGSAARFNYPLGIAFYDPDTIYVADTGNQTIRKITPEGVVTTVAGLAGSSGTEDGTGSDARFFHPSGLAIDNTGTLFVADSGNNTIRQATLPPAPFYLLCPPDISVTAAQGQNTALVNYSAPSASPGATITCAPPSGSAFGQGTNIVTCTAVDGTNSATCTFTVTVNASIYTFTTVAGLSSNGVNFNIPFGVAVDIANALYVSDSHNHVIRKLTSDGTATILAGLLGVSGPLDGIGGAARFNDPHEIVIDASGTVYVADTQNNAVRKITSAGAVSTLAGLAGNPGSSDGTGTDARFQRPEGLVLDSSGNVYVSDTGNNTIRKITPGGIVTTLAGAAVVFGSEDGVGSEAHFDLPASLALDSSGTIYVADSGNSTIRKITPAGVVSTWAGVAGSIGSADGTGNTARFNYPSGMKFDSSGNLYVSDGLNHTIRKITPAGVVSTIAGLAGIPGNVDGTGSAARFNNPRGLTVDDFGSIYVADALNDTIRKGTPAGVLNIFCPADVSVTIPSGQNTAIVNYSAPIAPATATVTCSPPSGSAFPQGTNIVTCTAADGTNSARCTFIVTVIAATNIPYVPYTFITLAGPSGSGVNFNVPFGVAVDAVNNIYVSDSHNHVLRKISSEGTPSILAGLLGVAGPVDGIGGAARFNDPHEIVIDPSGTVYVADTQNHAIRKITSSGAVSTLAGLAGSPGAADGTGTAARFNNPRGLALDSSGIIYVADALGQTIRKVTPAGQVSTLAGLGGISGTNDGVGSAVRFNVPFGIALDAANNLYVSDSHNNTIRNVTLAGLVTTVAGRPGISGNQDGTGEAVRFNDPHSIVMDSFGNIYVADTQNNSIRKGVPFGLVSIFCPANITVTAPAGQNTAIINYPLPVVPPQATVTCSPPSGSAFPEGTNIITCMAVSATNSISCTFQIIVVIPPSIVTQAENMDVTIGQPFTLSVLATGSSPLTYAWSFEGVAIAGATNSDLDFANAEPANEGIYQVLITNTVGTVLSSPLRVRVLPPSAPIIISEPASLTVAAGRDATFKVVVRGSPPLSFQWFKDGSALARGNEAQLLIENPQTENAGNYWVIVSNALGTATSQTATLAVADSPPFFVRHPLPVTVTNGANVTLTALARGSELLSYQWRQSGEALPGANDTSLTLSNVSLVANGSYDVIVFNLIGRATSSVAQVTVLQPPILQEGLTDQTVDAGSTVTLNVKTTGNPELSYAWQFNGAVLATATNSTLLLSHVQPGHSGYYRVDIANQLGRVSSTARLTVFGPISSVLAWGDDSGGQTQVPPKLNDVVAVSGGDFHTVALRRNGTLAAWGYNGDGQTSLPTNVTRYLAIASGSSHNLAIMESGGVLAWGGNESGQVNVPGNAVAVISVAAGDSHSLALLSSGTLVAWGNNAFGQGTVPQGIAGVQAIAAGRNHNLALQTNGTVVAWGLNNFGQASPPQGLSAVTAIAAGYLHSAAVLSNGTVTVWGDNTFGQTNQPAGLSNVVALAAGDFHTLALRSDGSIVGWGDDSYGQTEIPAFAGHAVGIASGYYHGLALLPTPVLHREQTASGLLLQWDGPAILQWSSNSIGPYFDLPGFSGSYTNTDFTLPAMFFRLRY